LVNYKKTKTLFVFSRCGAFGGCGWGGHRKSFFGGSGGRPPPFHGPQWKMSPTRGVFFRNNPVPHHGVPPKKTLVKKTTYKSPPPSPSPSPAPPPPPIFWFFFTVPGPPNSGFPPPTGVRGPANSTSRENGFTVLKKKTGGFLFCFFFWGDNSPPVCPSGGRARGTRCFFWAPPPQGPTIPGGGPPLLTSPGFPKVRKNVFFTASPPNTVPPPPRGPLGRFGGGFPPGAKSSTQARGGFVFGGKRERPPEGS